MKNSIYSKNNISKVQKAKANAFNDENQNPNIIPWNQQCDKNCKDQKKVINEQLPLNKGLKVRDQNQHFENDLNLKNNKNNNNLSKIPQMKDDRIPMPKKEESQMEICTNSNLEKEKAPLTNSFQILNKGENEEALIKEHAKNNELIINSSLSVEELNKFFTKRESDSLLLNYGEKSYCYNKLLEKTSFKIPDSLLTFHEINPYVRTKMVDWMVEVLSRYHAQDETFFLSVSIMDMYLYKCKYVLKDRDIHLIGIVSMFIATKFQDIYPIPLSDFEKTIGHFAFNQDKIKKKESEFMEEIEPENLVSTSVYDFLKTYFYDFFYNNKNLIESEEDLKIYYYIKFTSKYLAKVILHYELFYEENCSMRAIAVIAASLKIVSETLNEKFPDTSKKIYKDWLMFLYEQGGFDKKRIEKFSCKVYAAYNVYQKSNNTNRNLNKFMPLPFGKDCVLKNDWLDC